MTRRITCYVVYATLIWSAHTQDEEQVRGDMFKSNMTRNDFSKLLSSLIKLNEQRVNVLQKLYKLEDYGVLSEVLRSGDRKPENGNPNNLFLIVMSKGAIDAKTINKYQILSDDADNKPIEDAQSTEKTDEILNDLLELVDLEEKKSLSRRYNEDRENSLTIESVSDENDSIDRIIQRNHDKFKQNTDDKYGTKQENEETEEEKETRRHKVLRDERVKVKKELQRRCVSEIDSKIVKCIRACRRTQQDVCSRLTCTVGSRRELIKGCDTSCKETFVPEIC